jgi:hypothetical protein
MNPRQGFGPWKLGQEICPFPVRKRIDSPCDPYLVFKQLTVYNIQVFDTLQGVRASCRGLETQEFVDVFVHRMGRSMGLTGKAVG